MNGIPADKNILIRAAAPKDAGAIRDIYRPYVTDTCVTFETAVPGRDDFARRIQSTLLRYPWLCAEEDGKIVGYCYASAFHVRSAYRWTCENSIYLSMDARGRGVGSLLERRLEDILVRQGFTALNACITYPNPESVAFHEKHGFTLCAHFHRCGYKMGRWLDVVWMEKELLPREGAPAEPVPFPEADLKGIL